MSLHRPIIATKSPARRYSQCFMLGSRRRSSRVAYLQRIQKEQPSVARSHQGEGALSGTEEAGNQSLSTDLVKNPQHSLRLSRTLVD